MKNKLSIKLLTRWIAAPLLVGCLFAWVVSPAYPSDVVSRVVQPQKPQVAIKVASDNASDVQDIKDRIKELESKERQNFTLLLDDQRKKIDWWFSFLAVLTAVMAIAGGLIPFLMGRKDKEIIEQDKELVSKIKADVIKLFADAKNDADKIHRHEASAAVSAAIMQTYQSKPERKSETESIADEEKNSAITTAVTAVKEDKTADPILRLRAEAIAASEEKNAEKAYALWNALTQLNQNDARAQFNAGYWAHDLGERDNATDFARWLKLAGSHYAQTLRIQPDMHEAAYNWGSALHAEGNASAPSNLADARILWQQAGEKYQKALDIKSDMHEAANNWGLALLHEAVAIEVTVPEQSSLLLNQAESILLAHAGAAPGVVSYNLACVHARRGDVEQCLQWLKVSESHKELPDCEHIREDKDLDAVRNAPDFVEWFATVCGSTGSPRTDKETQS